MASQISSVLPAGSLQGDNYIWHATGSLEPYLSATDPESVDSENNYAFLSGITFGVGGAAAIALLQELPKEISVSYKRRKIFKRRPKTSQPA
jgi:hypothetical protein